MWVKYVSTIVGHTFCLSVMKTRLSCSGFPMSFENCYRNHTHESLFSCSTTANATRKILSFASLTVAASICPPNLPFRWHLSKPMIGLQPPKKPTFCALYLIYILLNLGYAFSSSISICKITLLPLSFNLIIFTQSLSFSYCNYSSPVIKSVAFFFAQYT